MVYRFCGGGSGGNGRRPTTPKNCEIRFLSSKTLHRHTSHICIWGWGVCVRVLWWCCGEDATRWNHKEKQRTYLTNEEERTEQRRIQYGLRVCCANERNIIHNELLLLLLLPRRIAALLISAYNVLSSVANATVCLRANTLHITRSYSWCEIHDEIFVRNVYTQSQSDSPSDCVCERVLSASVRLRPNTKRADRWWRTAASKHKQQQQYNRQRQRDGLRRALEIALSFLTSRLRHFPSRSRSVCCCCFVPMQWHV